MLRPARHLLARPSIALRHHLAPELAGVGTASDPAFLQIRRKPVNLTGVRFGSGPLWKGLGIGEIARRRPTDTEALRYLRDRQSNGVQGANVLISGIAPCSAGLPCRRFLRGVAHLGRVLRAAGLERIGWVATDSCVAGVGERLDERLTFGGGSIIAMARPVDDERLGAVEHGLQRTLHRLLAHPWAA